MFSYLHEHKPDTLEYAKTVNSGHGRLEIRRCWLFQPSEYSDYLSEFQRAPEINSIIHISILTKGK